MLVSIVDVDERHPALLCEERHVLEKNSPLQDGVVACRIDLGAGLRRARGLALQHASEKSISVNEDVDSFDKSDENDLSSEISYQVEKDENNEKVLKLKIDLIIEDA